MSVNAASIEERAIPFAASDEAPRDDARVTQFVHEHYAFVWRILRRFGLSQADADDAAQGVFLVASGRLGDIEPGKSRAFLFRTAMFVAAKARRSRLRRREDPDDAAEERVDDGTPAADDLLDQQRARALLDRILDEMPDELKSVIVLFEIEGLTMSEIGDALDVPPGTVASRLRRARVDLEARVVRHREGLMRPRGRGPNP